MTKIFKMTNQYTMQAIIIIIVEVGYEPRYHRTDQLILGHRPLAQIGQSKGPFIHSETATANVLE